jgi:hypothetical protein
MNQLSKKGDGENRFGQVRHTPGST